MSWAAYNAERTSQVPISGRFLTPTTLLPIFEDKATSPAVIAHIMKLIRESTEVLNQDQTPVATCDQPYSQR